ncbi:MAG: uroporphyrinogen decarboxylase [Candidatus Zixiibacteriota bacterium]
MSEFEFIKAALRQPHEKVPVWIMRQAGRYLPEFRAVREKASFWDICRSAELMADVTLQPIDIFGFDAAILFSDILLPLEPMGVKVSYDNGGPTIVPPVRTPGDVKGLKTFVPADEMAYVLAGIKEIKNRLQGRVPLIGFCGSPFTLACYLIEGTSNLHFHEIKKFICTYPNDALSLLGHLAELTGKYLKAQIDAGVEAVQLFDSWGGILSPDYYRKFSLPFIKTVFDICKTNGIPRILYLNNSAPYLELLAELDCEVIGVDWRTDLRRAKSILDGKALQGNFDPQMLFGPAELVCEETSRILEMMADTDGFIFNLGHGILPQTPVENVRLLVNTVHAFSRAQNGAPQ